MKLLTKYHGEQVIEENEIIAFEEGIPGFPDEKKFVLIRLTDDQSFFVLQSVTTSSLAFIVTSPFLTYPNYEFKVDDEIVASLGLTEEYLNVFSIVTAKDAFEESTINLQAPLIIDTKKGKGKQIILNQTNYQTRTPLFPKVESKGE